MFDLSDKRVLVTGAAGGLGIALVEELLAQGAHVLRLVRTVDHPAVLDDAAAAGRVVTVAEDLGEPAALIDIVRAEITKNGPVFGLVNNAAIYPKSRVASLAPHLSIARNLFLGREPVRLKWLGLLAPIDLPLLKDQASKLLQRVGIKKALNANAPVSLLSGGERQSISISRAMQFLANIIILDEPTNNLGVEETHGVLKFIKDVRAAGHSLIYITHNIHHVFEVCDRAIIMRQGEVIADVSMADSDVITVEGIITGGDLSKFAKARKNA